jgi:hypothetical protein
MKDLFIWKFFLAGNEVPGWSLTESNTTEENKNKITREYYWQSNQGEDEAVKIDVIECPSRQEAQKTLLNMLENHMAMSLPEFSFGNNTRLGDAAYAGSGKLQIHVLFIRANMVVVINSIGEKDIAVPQIAVTLDEIFYQKPKPSEKAGLPVITEFAKTKQVINVKDRKATGISIEAADPSGRPVWFKFFIGDGEIFRENDHIFYTAGDNKENRLSVFVTNDRGEVSVQSIII